MANAIDLATRIKRKSRDPEVLELCEIVLSEGPKTLAKPANEPKKRNRTNYMRDFMRKKRAEIYFARTKNDP